MSEESTEKFDPASLKDLITERIQIAFVELIPETACSSMVEKQLAAFTEPRIVPDGYNRTKTIPSLLDELIYAEIKSQAAAVIKSVVDTYQWDGSEGAKIVIENVIRENMPEITASFFKKIIAMMMPEIAQSISNTLASRY